MCHLVMFYSERTVFVMPPDATGLPPDEVYRYLFHFIGTYFIYIHSFQIFHTIPMVPLCISPDATVILIIIIITILI